MVFSSFVFLLAFLPIVLLLYYLCPARLRNLVLLVFSLVFYAWGEPVYVLIMLFSIVFDYANGRLIEHFKNKNCPGKAKAALIVDLCGNLAILGFFKYTDFVIGSINSITGAGLSLLHIALPIGISFYTFQTMSYTIDVYRGEVAAQKNILTFATYVTLFPHAQKSHAGRFFRRSISFFRGSGKESASGKSDRKSVGFHFTVESHVGGYGMAWCNCIQFSDLF